MSDQEKRRRRPRKTDRSDNGPKPARPMNSPLPNPDRRLHQMGNPLPTDARGTALPAESVQSVRPKSAPRTAAGQLADAAAKNRTAHSSGLAVSGFHHTRLVHTYSSELVFRSISEDQLDILEEGTPSVLLDGLCGLCIALYRHFSPIL